MNNISSGVHNFVGEDDPCTHSTTMDSMPRRLFTPNPPTNVPGTYLHDYYLKDGWYNMPGFRLVTSATHTCEARYTWYMDGMW